MTNFSTIWGLLFPPFLCAFLQILLSFHLYSINTKQGQTRATFTTLQSLLFFSYFFGMAVMYIWCFVHMGKMGAETYVHACVENRGVCVSSFIALHYIFLGHGLSPNPKLTGWLVTLWDPPVSPTPSARATTVALCGYSGSELSSSCLCGSYFTNCAVFSNKLAFWH